MKISILLVILCAALCFGQTPAPVVPVVPVVPVPPVVSWFGIKPPIESVIQVLLDHPAVVFEALHNHDMLYCTNGPADSWRYPEVRRCDGAI